jgi:hypothetical protein
VARIQLWHGDICELERSPGIETVIFALGGAAAFAAFAEALAASAPGAPGIPALVAREADR